MERRKQRKGKENQSQTSKNGSELCMEVLKTILPEDQITEKHREYMDMFVWDMAHSFTTKLFHISMHFPKEVLWSLTMHLRQCCVTIPTQIAFCWSSEGPEDALVFLKDALSFAYVTDYLLRLAVDIKLLNRDVHKELQEELQSVKSGLKGCILQTQENINQQHQHQHQDQQRKEK